MEAWMGLETVQWVVAEAAPGAEVMEEEPKLWLSLLYQATRRSPQARKRARSE